MWRRIYLLLAVVRLYFALSPSYLHPDENFQGPEVIAGQIFNYPVHLTWEFTSANPIRSIFPLYPIYGLPMYLLKWLWLGNSTSGPSPAVVFYVLRLLMFFLSFVLEDWAIQELCPKPRDRRYAVLLVASSYVTWTYQTHTFSNSIETILVVWSLVLVKRILEDRKRSSPIASAILAILVVFGTFNRITFPAFLIIPGLRLLPHFSRKPISFLIMAVTGLLTLSLAITLDTDFYASPETPFTLRTLFTKPVITPLNNLLYNLDSSNLALHGTHPRYQHILANLPQLLGPAFILLFTSPRPTLALSSALSGLFVLSMFAHQEARFLLPTIPLLLSSVKLPESRRAKRAWILSWVAFNAVMGLLMGRYHQGGIVPMQFHIARMEEMEGVPVREVSWWKTYSPPVWLLNGKNEVVTTRDLMGMRSDDMIATIGDIACNNTSSMERLINTGVEGRNDTYLVAPLSAAFLEPYQEGAKDRQKGKKGEVGLEMVWQYKAHLNLDDLDFGDDGVWPTLSRVVGKRGLGLWRVSRECREET